MVGDRLCKALVALGAISICAGGWFGWRDFGDRRGVTVNLSGLDGLSVETHVEHAASFTLRNHTFRPAKLVSGEPG